MSRLFILRPIATSLLMLALACLGLLSWKWLPVSALPQVDYPSILVQTFYPGASPQLMADNITAPLEKQLGQMPNLIQMSSNSTLGVSNITLTLDLNLSLDMAEQQVQAAINAANSLLPNDLPMPPIYYKVNPADVPILTLSITSDNLPLYEVQNLVDTHLLNKLSQVSGVGLVSLAGNQRKSLRIELQQQKLASLGLSADSIRALINNQHLSMSKGSINGATRASSIDTNDQLLSIKDYNNLILLYKDGKPIYLTDIARIHEQAENKQLLAWSNTHPALLLNIQRQPNANAIEVSERIRAILPNLLAQLPEQVHVDISHDRTLAIKQSLSAMYEELLLAITLVILVIFIFLRQLPATLIPSLAIPLSLLGTLTMIYWLGFSINNLTLMALLIATGFVVDDAIVMIENIARHRELGSPPIQAAIQGASQIQFTILSLSVSLIAVLIPLLFMTDMTGRLFHEFAITLSIAIVFSALISLTLTPMLSARLLPSTQDEQPPLWIQQLTRYYLDALTWSLAHKPLILATVLGLILSSLSLYQLIGKNLFPNQDTGSIVVITQTNGNLSFAQVSQRHQALIDQLLAQPSISSVTAFIGSDGQNNNQNQGRLTIQLKPLSQRESMPALLTSLNQLSVNYPDMQLTFQPQQELTIEESVTAGQYHFRLASPFEDELQRDSQALWHLLQQQPALAQVQLDAAFTGQQLYLHINHDLASQLGFSNKDISLALYNAFAQRPISTIFTQSQQYRVILTSDLANNGLAALNHVYVTNNQGQTLPLSQLVTPVTIQAPLSIGRLDQLPSTLISFNIQPGYSLSQASAAITLAAQQAGLHPSTELRTQGALNAFDHATRNQLWLMLAAILTVYIVLGVLYESLIHPITILSTLLPATTGALLTLYLLDYSLDMMGVIGLILLIGIVKKNAIMMIDFALEAMRQHRLSAEEAILQACQQRLRPILMTTMATLFAALPLLLWHQLGHELREPMGWVLVGGLLLSQLMTLFISPVLFVLFENLFSAHHETANN